MVRRGGDADASGEGTSWLVLRHVQAEGLGLLEPELTVFHMHGDTYELPADARHLARSALYEQQAFRWGDVVYGLQFHLEFTETMIQKLTTEADSRAYITGAGVDPQSLVRDAATHVRRLGMVVEKVFSEFFAQCGL